MTSLVEKAIGKQTGDWDWNIHSDLDVVKVGLTLRLEGGHARQFKKVIIDSHYARWQTHHVLRWRYPEDIKEILTTCKSNRP